MKRFGERVEQMNIQRKRASGGYFYHGINLVAFGA